MSTTHNFQTIADHAPALLWAADAQAQRTYCNQSWLCFTGRSLRQELGHGWLENVHPDDLQNRQDTFLIALQSRQPFSMAYRLRQASGAYRWVLDQGVPQFQDNHEFTGYIGSCVDITELKQTALQAATTLAEANCWRDRYEAAGRASNQALYDFDVRANRTTWSENAAHLFGYASSVLSTWGLAFWRALIHPADRPRFQAVSQALLTEHVPFQQMEYRVQRQDGSYLWIQDNNEILFDAMGTPIRVIGFVADISARKQTEAALRASEAKNRAMLTAIPDLLLRLKLDGTCLDFIPPAPAVPDFVPIQAHIREVVPPDLLRYQLDRMAEAQATGKLQVWEQQFWRSGVLADEEVRLVHCEQDEFVMIVRDITDRKRAEVALRESEAKNRAIIEAIPDCLLCVGRDGTCYDFIAPNSEHSGQFLPVHENIAEVLPPEVLQYQLQRIEQALATQQLQVWEHQIPKQGVLCDEEVRLVPCGADECLLIVRDISDRKRAALALQESEERRRLALELTDTGSWEFEVATGLAIWSDSHYRLIGLEPSAAPSQYQTWRDRVHPDDLDFTEQAFAQALATQSLLTVEYRVVHPDGTVRWMLTKGQGIYAATGHPVKMLGVMMDISDRKAAELALQQLNEELEHRVQQRTQELAHSAQDLRTIFNNVYDAISIHDLDGTILDLNDRALEIRQATRSQLLSAKLMDLAAPDAPIAQIPALLARVKAGETIRFEWRERRFSDGSSFDVEISLRQATWNNRPVFIAGMRDISDRKQAQQDLQESRNMLKLVLDTIPQRVFWKDRQSRFLGCNSAFAQDYQLTIEEIVGKTDQELPHSELVPLYQIDEVRVMRTGLPQLNEEEPSLNHAGKQIWIRSSKIPLTNTQGEVLGVLGCYDDISDLKQAEARLQEQAQFLRSIYEGTAQPIFVVNILPDRSARVAGWNPIATQLLGKSSEAVEGKTITEVFPPDEATAILTRLAHCTQIQEPTIFEEQIEFQGQTRWMLSTYTPLMNPKGQVYRVVGTVYDITERKQAEQALQQLNLDLEQRVSDRTRELQQAMEAAKAANRAKSTFLANMSHELRTPLNAILGFAQLMSRDLTIEAEKRDQLGIINRSGKHLLNLINDILEMSKIEAGQATFTANSFDLDLVLETLADLFQMRAIEKQLTWIVDRPDDLPRFITTDEQKLRQVLINLISNAIKFTTAGYVRLDIQLQAPSGSETMLLQFAVVDSGMGIADDELDSLFEPFMQSKRQPSTQEGTGLGLPISRQFVQLMGGDLSVTSTVGIGSTFSFTIPVQRAEASAVCPSSPVPLILNLAPHQPPYRILVAEDHEMNRHLLVQLLRSVGFVVQSATNGREAIALWASWHPHLILMDIRMPSLSGDAATQQIRQLEQQQPNTPATTIIALTANAFEEERVRVLAIGCNDFVRKPFEETTLLEKLQTYLGVEYLYATPAPATPAIAQDWTADAALQTLPPALRQQLMQATVQLDQQRLTSLLEQVAVTAPALAITLRQKLNNFDFEQILQLLEPADAANF